MKDEIESYCRIYEEIHNRVSRIDSENASEVALGIFKEIVRDLRRKPASQLGKNKTEEDLATVRQREALHKFRIKRIPEDLSKREASEILEKLINFSKDGDKAGIGKLVEELNQKWSKGNFQQRKK